MTRAIVFIFTFIVGSLALAADCEKSIESTFIAKAKESQAFCNIKGNIVAIDGEFTDKYSGAIWKHGIFYCASTPFFIGVAFDPNTCAYTGATHIGAKVVP